MNENENISTAGELEAADTAQANATTAENAEKQAQEAAETEEAYTPTLATAKPSKGKNEPPTMEERMLEMLLKEQHPDTLANAVSSGKTIRGAWNYVVSVMRNAYIAAHGRVDGGMVGDPDVVVGLAERYLREYPEGTIEAEVSHTPKPPKAEPPTKPEISPETKAALDKAKAASEVVRAAKSAANAAKAARAAAKAAAEKAQMTFGF